MNEQEQRVWSSKLTLRAEDGEMPTLEGLAVAYDEEFPVRDYYGTYTGVWRAGSTRNAAQDDVVLLVDHDGLPLARTTSGTLNLREDSKGLHVSAQSQLTRPDSLFLCFIHLCLLWLLAPVSYTHLTLPTKA